MTIRNTPQQPDTRRSIFLNLSLFQFLCFVRRGVFYTFMINYLYTLVGESATLTTLLGTFNMIGSSLGQNLLWGKISDRYGLRAKLILTGESIAAIAYFIVFQIHKSLINMQADFSAGLSLIIGLSILEFFWSMSDVGWAALLTDTTTTETRGAIVGALNSIAALGRMIGIVFAGFLYDNGNGFSSGTIFYIVIGMLAVSATIMWITSRSTQKRTTKTEELIKDAPETSARSINGKIYKWFLLSLIVIIMGTACVSQIFLLFLPLTDGLVASAPEMSLILTAWTLSGMLTCLLCGRLADRFGRIRILFAAFILATLTPLFYGLAPDVLTMAFIYGLNGVSFWTVQTVGFAFAGDIIPEDRRGRLLSRYNMVVALSWGPAGLLIGGPLADLQTKRLGLSDHTAFINVFYASAIIVAIGTLLFAVKVAGSKQKAN